MSPQLEQEFDLVEEIIVTAARSPVMEIPAALSQAVAILESIRASAVVLPPDAHRSVVARLESFRARLKIFSSAMLRGEAILQGYARRTGIAAGHYGPAGMNAVGRDPAFLNLTA